jgi:hypothetical protein
MSHSIDVTDNKILACSEELPRTFRFYRPFWVGIWLVVMISVGIFFVVIEAKAGEYAHSLFFVFDTLAFMFLGVYGTAGGSDIYI